MATPHAGRPCRGARAPWARSPTPHRSCSRQPGRDQLLLFLGQSFVEGLCVKFKADERLNSYEEVMFVQNYFVLGD